MTRIRGVAAAWLVACLSMAAVLTTPVWAAAKEPKPQTLFINVNVFDGKADKLATGMSVLVEGNLIEQVAKGEIKVDGAKIIDGGGRTLMPGMIDSHSHFNMNVDGGVTKMEGLRWDEIAARAAAQAADWLADGRFIWIKFNKIKRNFRHGKVASK